MLAALADADTESTSSKTMGIVENDISNGSEGFVVTEGLVVGLNTSTATAGQSVWLSSTAGGFVYGAPPAEPANSVYLGVVTRVQSINGEIFVKVQNGYELDELHDVFVGSAATGDLLVKTSTGWGNQSLVTAGIATTSALTSGLAGKANTSHTHAASDITSGSLALAQGGTGVATGAGLVPIIPTSISVGSGTASLNTSTGRITCTSASNILLNGVFTSTYRNYLVIINNNQSGPNNHQVRFSVGGSIDSSTNYTATFFYVQAGGTGAGGYGTAQSIATTAYGQYVEYWVHDPAISDRVTDIKFDTTYTHTRFMGQAGYNASKAFDGIWLANNAISGEVMVYGIRD
jgi:hypothetical protein